MNNTDIEQLEDEILNDSSMQDENVDEYVDKNEYRSFYSELLHKEVRIYDLDTHSARDEYRRKGIMLDLTTATYNGFISPTLLISYLFPTNELIEQYMYHNEATYIKTSKLAKNLQLILFGTMIGYLAVFYLFGALFAFILLIIGAISYYSLFKVIRNQIKQTLYIPYMKEYKQVYSVEEIKSNWNNAIEFVEHYNVSRKIKKNTQRHLQEFIKHI